MELGTYGGDVGHSWAGNTNAGQTLAEGAPLRMIVCAAVRDRSGDVVCSARHFDTLMNRQLSRSTLLPPHEQGFVDQHGVFLTREEAFTVAFDAGQIMRRVGGDEGKLFSENLY